MKTTLKKGSIGLFAVAPGVWGMKDVFVNIYMIKNDPSETKWWLVDAGVSPSGAKIKGMANLLFGEGSRPEAIILTHGHFDHVGSLKKLAHEWNVPVYAHHLEVPYLTGLSSYPPADPAAGGGLLADLSFLYPKGPVHLEDKIAPLPTGGTIPGLPDWQYLHTPGHAAGHISLFRSSDKVLIAGDAVVTTKAESLTSTILQLKKLSGPPRYFTSDWLSAASSVAELAALEPEILAAGHGRPMRGAGMRKSLHSLSMNFNRASIPAKGRYSHQPALMDDSGVVHIPPKNINASTAPTLKILGVAAAVLLTVLLFSKSKKKKARKKIHELKAIEHKAGHNVKAQLLKKKAIKATTDLKSEIKDITSGLASKSKAVSKTVGDKVEHLKEPAINILDKLKFTVKKKLR